LAGRSELGVALLLLILGVVVLWDASRIATTFAQRGPVGPKAVPVLVGTLLVICAVLLARDVLAGGHGEAEAGEDIDLSHGSDWRTLLLLAGAFLANAALIEAAGWVISGAVLFWGSAYALGSRHWIRDPLIAIAMSVASFYLFTLGLGITLPAGILTGIL
jgi:putative tricarboxylic transport membrane protein